LIFSSYFVYIILLTDLDQGLEVLEGVRGHDQGQLTSMIATKRIGDELCIYKITWNLQHVHVT